MLLDNPAMRKQQGQFHGFGVFFGGGGGFLIITFEVGDSQALGQKVGGLDVGRKGLGGFVS